MITVRIKITVPLWRIERLVLPQPQNPLLIRFACAKCGQHLSATCDQIGMTAPCVTCSEVIRVPIQSTLPPQALILPQSQNSLLIRFPCARCGQHLSATLDQIGMIGTCPNCNEVMKVPIQSTLPLLPLIWPQESAPENTTWGVALQVIGMLLCWTVVGAILGIPLIIVGRRMATTTCSLPSRG